jgi:hypothetical protein
MRLHYGAVSCVPAALSRFGATSSLSSGISLRPLLKPSLYDVTHITEIQSTVLEAGWFKCSNTFISCCQKSATLLTHKQQDWGSHSRISAMWRRTARQMVPTSRDTYFLSLWGRKASSIEFIHQTAQRHIQKTAILILSRQEDRMPYKTEDIDNMVWGKSWTLRVKK